MTSRWLKFLLALLVAGYILALALIAAFFEFPYEAAADLLKNRIEASAPLRLELSAPRAGFPFSLNLNELNIGLADSSETLWVFKSNRVRLRLKPTRLLIGRICGLIEAEAWEGRVKGRFEYQLFGSQQFCLSFSEIEIPGFSLRGPGQSGVVSGTLRGRLVACGQGQVFPHHGSGRMSLGPGRFTGRPLPDLPSLSLDFDLLDLDFSLGRDQVTIKNLALKNPEINIKLAGRIINLKEPVLILSGSALLGPANRLRTRINFNLTGPAIQPRLKLGPALSAPSSK
ncbi:MAG: hypothetical protein JRI95_00055 [Deltaproteobacteria bacterium]|nr:hypothetical protein [Deltaproteobacteria bacterium]MBW2086496.1 hypothetical protein [Deltaproteobacteria bacterium]